MKSKNTTQFLINQDFTNLNYNFTKSKIDMAARKMKPDIDERDLMSNPLTFASDFIVRVRDMDKTIDMVDVNAIKDGVITSPPNKIVSRYVVEDELFTKIYSTSALRKNLMGCTPKAKDLLWFIVYELECGKDWLWINKKRYMEESNVSLNTYKAAIKELVRYNFIQVTLYTDVYWINPMYFFKGDRIKKYPKHVQTR